MNLSPAWKRAAGVSLALVMIPLPLMVMLRVTSYGIGSGVVAALGWGCFAWLYFWPLAALHLYLKGSRWRRWTIGFLCSVPLFLASLAIVYAAIGSRFAPASSASWISYLSNTPTWFLLSVLVTRLMRDPGRLARGFMAVSTGLLVVSLVGTTAYVSTLDRYRWPATGPTRWRITHVSVIDPATGSRADDRDVLIDGDRIESVIESVRDSASTPAVDGAGRFLVPGLIDAHLHLGVPVEGGTLKLSPGFFLESMLTAFAPHRRALIESGVVAVRDVGGAAEATARIKTAVARHDLLGPRMFTVGRLVTSPDGHPAGTIWTRELRREGAIEATDSTMLVNALERDRVRFKPDGVKLIFGTIGRARTRLDPGLLRIGVAWARSHQLWVAVHAETAEEVGTAAAAGATTVEHAGSMEEPSDSLIALIVRQQTWLDPTLGEWCKAMQLAGRSSAFIAQGLLSRQRSIARLRIAGARFIVGTDVPLVRYGSGLHDELDLLRGAGFTEPDLVRLVTSNNARALGQDSTLGAIARGYRADFILVSADPLADARVLRAPKMVVRDGQVVLSRH